MFEIATCLRLAVQPNISCSAVSQLLVDLTCLGITDELLTNQSVTFRLCPLVITLLLCHRKHVQCTSSQDMHWRGCELHLKHWLKRHASLPAKVLPSNLLHSPADCSQACLAIMSKIAWHQQPLCLNSAAQARASTSHKLCAFAGN